MTNTPPTPEPDQASLTIIISSRNGGALLAQTLIALQRLSLTSAYGDLLRRTQVTEAEARCGEQARHDLSGKIFDLAVCAKAWPELSRAPPNEEFEAAFGRPVTREGLKAFPSVEVTAFEFQKRFRLDVFGNEAALVDKTGETPKLVDSLVAEVCEPKITFIPRERCKVELRMRGGLFQPDIYASQVGYRIVLNRDLPIETANRLRAELLKAVTARETLPSDDYSVVAFPVAPLVKSERREAPAGPVEGVETFWTAKGVKTTDIDLSSGKALPPTLLIFDGIDADRASDLQSWLQTLRDNHPQIAIGACPASLGLDAHTQGVASLLFPNDIASLLKPPAAPGAAAPAAPLPIEGYLLSIPHLQGTRPVSGDRYWFSQGVFREDDPRIVAVLPFSKPGQGVETVAGAIAKYLNEDRSRILVVSASERPDPPEDRSRYRDFDRGEPTTDVETLQEVCRTKFWPSCLGRHPQVLVVAPTESAAGSDRKLYAEPNYVLGASAVRLTAPGAAVPVLVPCATDPGAPPVWSLQAQEGTSYAAPLAALVLARIIQISPANVDDVPELAVWRLLATTDPLAATTPGALPERKVQFGELNAQRALRGLTAEETGPNSAATLYEHDDAGAPSVVQAVVAPFLWNDHSQAVAIEKPGVASKGGIEQQPRGFLTITPLTADNRPGKADVIPFRRIVRLTRRPGETIAGRPTFDLYYVLWKDDDPAIKTLAVKRRVLLGPLRFDLGDDIGMTGFCRYDGEPQPGCLYAWRAGASGFEPLDLRKIDDIVFPIFHSRATWIAEVQPTNLRQVTAATSPWRSAFCEARPRREAWTYLQKRKLAVDLQTLCPTRQP